MANQNTTHATKRVVRVVAVTFVALILLASGADQSAALICNSLHMVVRDAAALLPSFVLATWQILQPAAAAHHRFSVCAIQILLSWPLLQTVIS